MRDNEKEKLSEARACVSTGSLTTPLRAYKWAALPVFVSISNLLILLRAQKHM